MLNIRWSCNCLIFNMGIPISGKDGLYIEMGPRAQWSSSCSKRCHNWGSLQCTHDWYCRHGIGLSIYECVGVSFWTPYQAHDERGKWLCWLSLTVAKEDALTDPHYTYPHKPQYAGLGLERVLLTLGYDLFSQAEVMELSFRKHIPLVINAANICQTMPYLRQRCMYVSYPMATKPVLSMHIHQNIHPFAGLPYCLM